MASSGGRSQDRWESLKFRPLRKIKGQYIQIMSFLALAVSTLVAVVVTIVKKYQSCRYMFIFVN